MEEIDKLILKLEATLAKHKMEVKKLVEEISKFSFSDGKSITSETSVTEMFCKSFVC